MSRHKVGVIHGDITGVKADAIVNAANSALAMGGGVCGAIFRAAGPEKLGKACQAIGGCATGQAVATPAFGLETARVIIHAVGPIYGNHTSEDARRLLRSAYATAIERAAEAGCRSITFPAISTGIYGYPLRDASAEAVDMCLDAAKRTGISIMLVAFDQETAGVLRECLEDALRRSN